MLPLKVHFSNTFSSMPGVTKPLKHIGAWCTKHTFGGNFPAYLPHEGLSRRLNEEINKEFDEEIEHNLINLMED